jgi:apolipoprotein N-acyltransferase
VVGFVDADDDIYNAAAILHDGAIVHAYHKVFLPNYGVFDEERYFRQGREQPVFVIGGVKVGVSICFESLFPQISRLETLDGACTLVVITNDAWFGRTQAARQHLMMSQLRAVENSRYVIRGAATGISAIIDPWGRVRNQLSIFEQGIVRGYFRPRSILTPYARLGDCFAYACLVLALVAATRKPKQ